jgi:hypothetical protein
VPVLLVLTPLNMSELVCTKAVALSAQKSAPESCFTSIKTGLEASALLLFPTTGWPVA